MASSERNDGGSSRAALSQISEEIGIKSSVFSKALTEGAAPGWVLRIALMSSIRTRSELTTTKPSIPAIQAFSEGLSSSSDKSFASADVSA